MRSDMTRGLYVPGKGAEPLHVLTYKQGSGWICHCLEYDIRGKSLDSQEAAFIAMKRVIEALFDRTRYMIPKTARAAAPELWEAWISASGAARPKETAPEPEEATL